MNHSDDLDDTHLCIKCNATISGLEKYIEHRKQNCASTHREAPKVSENHKTTTNISTRRVPGQSTAIDDESSNLQHHHHSYPEFTFTEPEAPTSYVQKAEHGGKATKHLADAYDLTYELGADVFFSSLQLQSVQSSSSGTSGGGKISSSSVGGHIAPLSRQKSHTEQNDWLAEDEGGTESLMKVVHDMSEVKKHYENDFKSVKIDLTSDEDDGEEDDDEEQEQGVDFEDDVDDEDYDPREDAIAMGIKWKLSPMRHSPPTVPLTHTGGKWRPEHRPSNLSTTQLIRHLSPHWDEHVDEMDVNEERNESEQHPPAEHTKGKWVPGSKIQRLEYREKLVDLTALSKESYWCNICCRKLLRRATYDQHLRTGYHLKRAEPEQQLEKALLSASTTTSANSSAVVNLIVPKASYAMRSKAPCATSIVKKRKRRTTFYKCELCKHTMQRHLIGKHFISHYHYRRMQSLSPNSRINALKAILEHIHHIVLQAPYQCRLCCYYANTEAAFLQHWCTAAHLDQVIRQLDQKDSRLFCGYCQFECDSNDTMYAHLIGPEHKAVILAVNRSVPICISKRRVILCDICGHICHFNIELRNHFFEQHANHAPTGSASDFYQSRFYCGICGEHQRSRIALQRHEKYKHNVTKYHCGVCKLEFATALKARQHRKSFAHKTKAELREKSIKHIRKPEMYKEQRESVVEIVGPLASSEVKPASPSLPSPITCNFCHLPFRSLTEKKRHQATKHPQASWHECMLCNQSFHTAQALGRHTRSCQPTSSTSAASVDEIARDLKSWQCSECNFNALYNSDLIYHRLLHAHGNVSRNALLQCPLCPKSFRKHSLRCHLRHHTNEKIFECNRCEVKFARRSNLKNHMDIVHSDKEVISKLPKSSVVSKIKQVSKKTTRETKKTCICDICGKTLANKYTLQLHRKNHTQAERRFVCTFKDCQYAGSTRHILNVHLASHSQQSFKCDYENCDYVGKSAMHLRRHSQNHVERLKLINCAQCDFKTHIKSHMTRHMRRHTGEKPYQCPHCDFRCGNFDNLRKHILKTNKHPGKFMYECEVCAKLKEVAFEQTVFKTNNFLAYQQHIATAHPQNAEMVHEHIENSDIL